MVTWIRYSTQGGDPQDVRFHPNNPDVVYGCSAHGSVCGFSVSTRKVIRNNSIQLACHIASIEDLILVDVIHTDSVYWDKLKLQRWSTWPTRDHVALLFILIYSFTY